MKRGPGLKPLRVNGLPTAALTPASAWDWARKPCGMANVGVFESSFPGKLAVQYDADGFVEVLLDQLGNFRLFLLIVCHLDTRFATLAHENHDLGLVKTYPQILPYA